MPIAARIKSERGINQQTIFEDNEDYARFIDALAKYKEIGGFELYAYCLISNHVHLLIKAPKEDIGITMKRLATSYVYYYNSKYKRQGHLFQDRYKSNR